jgi:hypothetical protein
MASLAPALFLTGQSLPFPSAELVVAGRVLPCLAFLSGLVAVRTLDRAELAVLTRLVHGRKPPPAEQARPIR